MKLFIGDAEVGFDVGQSGFRQYLVRDLVRSTSPDQFAPRASQNLRKIAQFPSKGFTPKRLRRVRVRAGTL
jgi:hypothetical protein